jgi:Tfp pilus assembly protein PilO
MNLNNIQEINYKQKLLVLTSIFVLFIFVLFYFLVKPTIADVEKLRFEILAKKIETEKNINKEKNKSILGAKIKKIEPKLQQFDKIFVSINKNLEFITTLEGVVDKHNLDQTIGLNTKNYDDKKAYNVVPVTLSTTGNFKNITSYLNSIESLTYYLKITSLSMTRLESLDTQTNVSLNLTIDTYWK